MGIFHIRKLHEDSDTIIARDIRLLQNQSIDIKDHRGFMAVSMTSDGDIKRKGRDIKI